MFFLSSFTVVVEAEDVVYSGKNGMTPRKLASLFSPYFFGLPDDESFDKTYAEWQARTDATEHIIISFVSLTLLRIGPFVSKLFHPQTDSESASHRRSNSYSSRNVHSRLPSSVGHF